MSIPRFKSTFFYHVQIFSGGYFQDTEGKHRSFQAAMAKAMKRARKEISFLQLSTSSTYRVVLTTTNYRHTSPLDPHNISHEEAFTYFVSFYLERGVSVVGCRED